MPLHDPFILLDALIAQIRQRTRDAQVFLEELHNCAPYSQTETLMLQAKESPVARNEGE
jgi:hypothetical protein